MSVVQQIESPRMKVDEILDDTTILLSGENLFQMHIGDEVLVLALLERPQSTIAIPKAKLEVTDDGGSYLIARPPIVEREVRNVYAELTGSVGIGSEPKKRRVRDSLRIESHEAIGNPAREPVRKGDHVVRSGELAEFVAWINASRKR